MIRKYIVIWAVLLSTLSSACNFSEKAKVNIPVSKTNLLCINQYLKKIHYIEQDSDLKLTALPINVGFPQELVGTLEITEHSNRDMKAVYKGLEVNCFPTLKRTRYIRADDWTQLGKDMIDVSQGGDSYINKNDKVYLEVDFAKNKYDIFQ